MRLHDAGLWWLGYSDISVSSYDAGAGSLRNLGRVQRCWGNDSPRQGEARMGARQIKSMQCTVRAWSWQVFFSAASPAPHADEIGRARMCRGAPCGPMQPSSPRVSASQVPTPLLSLASQRGTSLRAHLSTASATHVRSRRIGKRLAPRHDLAIGEIDIDAMTRIRVLIAVCS